MTLLAVNVKELRGRLGVTQAELAAALKVDRVTVVRWEGGEQRPSRLAERALRRLVTKVERRERAQAE